VIRYRSLETGAVMEEHVGGTALSPSYWPNVFSVWEDLSLGIWWARTPPVPVAVFFETRQAVARFERVLDTPDVRLAELRQ
jgi:hypothetical protein